MGVEMNRDEPAPGSSRSPGLLWVQFHNSDGPGPSFGPFTEVDAETWILETRGRNGEQGVLARRSDAPDELGDVDWMLADNVTHPGEQWPRFVVVPRRPAAVACSQCAKRAATKWVPSAEIGNADAYRTLVRWAEVYGLHLYPDGRVGGEIFDALLRRGDRPEVAKQLRHFGPLQTYTDDEIVTALHADPAAVYVTTSLTVARQTPSLLPEIPRGRLVATIKTGGMLSRFPAGIALARKAATKLGRPEMVFKDPDRPRVLVVGVIDSDEILMLEERRLSTLELLGEVLRRPIPRRSYRALKKLLPHDGPPIVACLKELFDEDRSIDEVIPGDVVDVDDLP